MIAKLWKNHQNYMKRLGKQCDYTYWDNVNNSRGYNSTTTRFTSVVAIIFWILFYIGAIGGFITGTVFMCIAIGLKSLWILLGLFVGFLIVCTYLASRKLAVDNG